MVRANSSATAFNTYAATKFVQLLNFVEWCKAHGGHVSAVAVSPGPSLPTPMMTFTETVTSDGRLFQASYLPPASAEKREC